jgi:hypothetical protein
VKTGGGLRFADIFVLTIDSRQAGKMARNLLEILVVAVNAALVGVHTDQRGTAKNFEG